MAIEMFWLVYLLLALTHAVWVMIKLNRTGPLSGLDVIVALVIGLLWPFMWGLYFVNVFLYERK